MIVYYREDGAVIRTDAISLEGYPSNAVVVNDEIGYMKIIKKVATKMEARKRILDIIPSWKQNNLTARATELIEKKIDGTITGDEQAELAILRATWNNTVKPIRTASDNIEIEINNLVTIEEINAYNVEGNPLWP